MVDTLLGIRDKLALILAACESSLELGGNALDGAARVLADAVSDLQEISDMIENEAAYEKRLRQ